MKTILKKSAAAKWIHVWLRSVGCYFPSAWQETKKYLSEQQHNSIILSKKSLCSVFSDHNEGPLYTEKTISANLKTTTFSLCLCPRFEFSLTRRTAHITEEYTVWSTALLDKITLKIVHDFHFNWGRYGLGLCPILSVSVPAHEWQLHPDWAGSLESDGSGHNNNRCPGWH